MARDRIKTKKEERKFLWWAFYLFLCGFFGGISLALDGWRSYLSLGLTLICYWRVMAIGKKFRVEVYLR